MAFNLKVDIDKAKDVHRRFIRTARQAKFAEADLKFIRALESGNDELRQEAVVLKSQLRDATQTVTLNSASTIEEIKESWDVGLLGDSPYTCYEENSEDIGFQSA